MRVEGDGTVQRYQPGDVRFMNCSALSHPPYGHDERYQLLEGSLVLVLECVGEDRYSKETYYCLVDDKVCVFTESAITHLTDGTAL